MAFTLRRRYNATEAMKTSVIVDARLVRTADGHVWTKVGFEYRFWTRYLNVFECVKVVARVRDVTEIDTSYERVSGPAVAVHAVPHYLGPFQYLKARVAIRRALAQSVAEGEAAIFRVGSRLADDLIPHFWRARRPYGLEVVGDPYDVFAPGAVRHPLRPLFRSVCTYNLKRQCASAAAVSYVTKGTLQRRYPSGSPDGVPAFTTHYSSIDLDESDFVAPARSSPAMSRPRLVFVGSFAQLYKAPDVLIRALHLLRQRGVRADLILIGDGKHRCEMEELVRSLNLQEVVVFRGEMDRNSVRKELDLATVFVLPSRTEGLPRAMIEAMARSLPCIGTNVGGIPELLHRDDMVEPESVGSLASRLQACLSSPTRLAEMSERNFKAAQEYRAEVLGKRRDQFYSVLRAKTEGWLLAQQESAPSRFTPT
jgi:glycosyltransferase involved in cell wall biosynthesis